MLRDTALLTASLFASLATARKATSPTRVPKDAVLLSKVESLTLRAGKLTASRRVSPVPQLECIGPDDVCKLYKVDTMRCTNEGADYDAENIQWSCKASLPEEFKLGSTEVICEGYESSEDPYILKGSCGVEYRLLLTDKGEAKYGGSDTDSSWYPTGGSEKEESQQSTNIPGALFMLIFLVILFLILRGMWSRWRDNPPRLGGGIRPNGGNDDDSDPPPPYDGPPSYTASRKQNTQSSTTRASTSRPQAGSSRAGAAPQQGSWRPGFWTGAAAGAAAGAFAANRSQNRAPESQPQPQPQMQQRPPYVHIQGPTRGTPPTTRPSASFSTPSFSTERHESTGFGGTRRR